MIIGRKLTCDGREGCNHPVTHIDEKGFIYCTIHGNNRRWVMRCRKLKPKELLQLQSGKPIARY